jgi:hypothetical protein
MHEAVDAYFLGQLGLKVGLLQVQCTQGRMTSLT